MVSCLTPPLGSLLHVHTTCTEQKTRGYLLEARTCGKRELHAGQVKVWDTSTGRCVHTLEGPTAAVEWVRWHPRGDIVLAGSEDFTAWMWNATTGVFMQACARP